MASDDRHGISALVLGSETLKVLTHCKIPVCELASKSDPTWGSVSFLK